MPRRQSLHCMPPCISDTRTLEPIRHPLTVIDLIFDYGGDRNKRGPAGPAHVLPAVVVDGDRLSNQWEYWHSDQHHQAGLELLRLQETLSHAMLVLL